MKKIIVLIPVKDEAWVMDTFLRVTSQFADHILVADQQSADDTVSIVSNYPKAILLTNPDGKYNNATRQQFLLNEARRLFGGGQVLLALDADEVVAAHSLKQYYWQQLRQLQSGTVIYLQKADLLPKAEQMLDTPGNYFPLGWVDDGITPHAGKPMHSVRLPYHADMPVYKAADIMVLHLQRMRSATQEAKRRFYQVKECDFGMNKWYWRRKRYSKADFHALKQPARPVPQAWLAYPEDLKVNIAGLKEAPNTWFDEEVLNCLAQNGSRRYWLDDIWGKDWKAYALALNKPLLNYKPAPVLLRYLLRLFDACFNLAYSFKSRIRS